MRTITNRQHAAVADMLGSHGFVVVNYAPGAGKAGSSAYVGRHRATCDVPPTERRKAMARLARVGLVVAVLVGALLALGGNTAHAATATAPACTPYILGDEADRPGYVDDLKAQGWTSRADDGLEALYAPGCDDADAWPIGAGLDAAYFPVEYAYGVTAEALWTGSAVASGWTVLDADAVPGHGTCVALIGDTTQVACADGFTTTS